MKAAKNPMLASLDRCKISPAVHPVSFTYRVVIDVLAKEWPSKSVEGNEQARKLRLALRSIRVEKR
jgi:hypothetical protein